MIAVTNLRGQNPFLTKLRMLPRYATTLLQALLVLTNTEVAR
ncbi:hypothetical protein [Streptomyces sp. SAJ15]|nr:hypothetical protein [Streptomyces sp. SAJ15]